MRLVALWLSPEATAYPHRDIGFVLNIHTRWRESADDAICITWARSVFKACEPFATGGVYVNFMPEEEKDRVGDDVLERKHARRGRALKAGWIGRAAGLTVGPPCAGRP